MNMVQNNGAIIEEKTVKRYRAEKNNHIYTFCFENSAQNSITELKMKKVCTFFFRTVSRPFANFDLMNPTQ